MEVSMEKILTIKDLYFNHKKSLTEISEIVKTSISYISKVLRKDIRYTEEKKKRKQENLTERKKIQKEIIYNKRREIKCTDNIDLKSQHEQAVKELSKSGNLFVKSRSTKRILSAHSCGGLVLGSTNVFKNR